MAERDFPKPVCPAARFVEGATNAEAGCVCTIMERDQARADRILEGAPVGVFVKASEDPHTYFNFCAGDGLPTTDPDVWTKHYSSCPVYAASVEWNGMQRVFGEVKPRPNLDVEGVEQEESRVFSEEDLQWL